MVIGHIIHLCKAIESTLFSDIKKQLLKVQKLFVNKYGGRDRIRTGES